MVAGLIACANRIGSPTDSSLSAHDASQVRQTIDRLTQPHMQGRGLGTEGLAIARTHLAGELRRMNLACVAAEHEDYLQAFSVLPSGHQAHNLIGLLPGRGNLSREYLVIAAHYDHLGLGPHAVNDPEEGLAIRSGADDNASGVAAVLLLTRRLAENPLPAPHCRNLLVILFSGEEHRCLGSRYFIEHLPELGISRESIVAMLNFDMVGRMRNDRVYVFGTDFQMDWSGRISPIARSMGIEPVYRLRSSDLPGQPAGPSDHAPFVAAGIPAIQFYTGIHEDYHRVTDTAEKIQVSGIVRLVNLSESLVRSLRIDPLPDRRANPPAKVN